MNSEPLLKVSSLKKYYPLKKDFFLENRKYVHAVDGIDFTIGTGETLGLVGESGCGKSTVGKLIAGIEKPTEGTVIYNGNNISDYTSKEMHSIRTEIQMIFQDSYASLNPRKRIYDIISEPMLYHGILKKDEAAGRIEQLLGEVGLPANAMQRYPHEFSGGQRQRISIARALSLNPKIIICDEPVSALDVSIQAQILNLLKDLQEAHGISYLFIAHGLGAVHYVSHRIAVMYLGKIVETGTEEQVFRTPLHPYSIMLLSAVPLADPTKKDRKIILPKGEVPSAVDIPEGCRFAERCPFASAKCRKEEPIMESREPGHFVACWNWKQGGRQ